jgi:hypothetical protein
MACPSLEWAGRLSFFVSWRLASLQELRSRAVIKAPVLDLESVATYEAKYFPGVVELELPWRR